MDFGENLKHAREQKGYTQQHLADELYVTRQAVSKWECGKRYPDLLTTKCIANILGVTIDSLVSNDEMEHFSEKQGVIQGQIGGKIISSVYAIITLLSFVELVQGVVSLIGNYKDFAFADYQLKPMLFAPVLLYSIISALSLVAFFKSVKDSITPKVAGLIGMIFYSYDALQMVATMAFNKPVWQMIIMVYIIIMFMLIIHAYFFGGKSKLAYLIYFGCIASSVYSIASVVFMINAMSSFNVQKVYITYIVGLLINLSFPLILVIQTIILEKKRKLCNK